MNEDWLLRAKSGTLARPQGMVKFHRICPANWVAVFHFPPLVIVVVWTPDARATGECSARIVFLEPDLTIVAAHHLFNEGPAVRDPPIPILLDALYLVATDAHPLLDLSRF